MRLIAEHTDQPVEKVEHDSARDRWFTADEARAYGFVDELLTDVAAVTPARSTRTVQETWLVRRPARPIFAAP